MADVRLTFYCAASDAEPLLDALRPITGAPLHLRDETVRGSDYGDAAASEQVVGRLARVAIELVVEDAEVDALIEAVRTARRGLPVRWQLVPVLRQGRLA
jgi:hypothetical protein